MTALWLADTPASNGGVGTGTIIAAALAVVASYIGYRQAVRVARSNAAATTEAARLAAEAEARKVDAGAYDRARLMYEAGIRQLEEQLARLRAQLAEEQQVSSSLRLQVRALEDTVARLRREIIAAGLQLPE